MTQELPSERISISVHAARVVYDGAALFDDLDFTLPAGRWASLLGPSGVGKTTLLRLIAGRIAYMAQQDLLLPWRSAIGNVLLGPDLRGQRDPDRHDRARALLDQVGLGDKRDALPNQLSGGQRQRVALARTLFEERPVVLMDEPFSALDALTRLRLQDLAADLLQGRTVLLVTHDPLEALRLSDDIRVMAGQPAKVSAAAVPPGAPPRAPDDTALLALQAQLLRQLGKAAS